MSAAAEIALTLPTAPGDAPQWVHLLPARTFQGVDGRGPYHADAAAIVAASIGMARGKVPLLIDFAHQTHLAPQTGHAAPAAGWVVDLQAREDGVWGRVEWTPGGRSALADKEYRFISPVFKHAKDGAILRLLGASLVNNPNLDQLPILNSARAPMDESGPVTLAQLLHAGRDRRTPAQADGRQMLMARIAALSPQDIVLAALEEASIEELRYLADMVEAEWYRYDALGFVDEAGLRPLPRPAGA